MTFDPYRKWLSIPEGHRPPTHYQLLGISPDERDREVINSAVVRQSAFVRHFQTGKHAAEATRLLGEIAAAKVCMLDEAKRDAYDAELRKTEKAEPSPGASPSHSNGKSQPSPATAPPPSDSRPFTSETLVRQPSGPAAPPSPTYATDRSSPRVEWSSPPADWATGELPGDADSPATSEALESVAPGLSFPDALWNEVSELPAPPTPTETKKVPTWLWVVLGVLVVVIVVSFVVVLVVKSAPPPDSAGQVQDAS
ncbi:MAG TPA: hypothetical protein VG125_09345 [Pirellulales bacterium]|nr:hypothetical protein [Pirellulales bacterium]